MNIDTFLTIGKAHKVCEDYIISGTNPMPYIILSDGCSSSKGTDMGARLLCYLAQQYIRMRTSDDVVFQPDHNEMGMWIIHNAELTAKHLGLPRQSLDATLIVAYHNEEDNIRVHMYGDGCIIEFFEDDGYVFNEVNYSKNAPYYLSYQIDPERHELFKKMEQKKTVKVFSQDTGWKSDETEYEYYFPSVYNFDLNITENGSPRAGISIASDGFISFNRGSQGPVNVLDYAYHFHLFKTTAGEFLKRRATMALRNMEKYKITNADDLSIGTFLLE